MGFFEIGINLAFAEKISSHLKSGRISASYVLAGSQDRLPLDFAVGFSKALNCQKLSGDFCDACQSCSMINARTHPDFAVYAPETARFGIGLVRKVQEDSVQTNYGARFRTNILTNAETMTVEAQNALLKMLEEGRKGCVNLLIAASIENLLPTILSRSIVLKLPPLSIEKTTELLKSAGLNDAQAEMETEACASEIRIPMWVMENPQLAEKIAALITRPGQTDPLSVVEALADDSQLEDLVRFINELVHRAELEKSGIKSVSPVFGGATLKVAAGTRERLAQIRNTVSEIERLWKTQIKKQQLLQTKLLSRLT